MMIWVCQIGQEMCAKIWFVCSILLLVDAREGLGGALARLVGAGSFDFLSLTLVGQREERERERSF